MIHPNTVLKFVSETIGYGVYAIQDIPEGSIVYVKDSLEIIITPTDYLLHTPDTKAVVDKYSYIDEKGNRIGYGKGFYDTFLARCRPDTIKIGLSFFKPETRIDGVFKGDIPLNYCVTPEKVYTF